MKCTNIVFSYLKFYFERPKVFSILISHNLPNVFYVNEHYFKPNIINECYHVCYLHLQRLKSFEQETDELQVQADVCLTTVCTLVPCSADFGPRRRRLNLVPKRRFTYGLHDAIFQKIATFISTTASTSNPLLLVLRHRNSRTAHSRISGRTASGLSARGPGSAAH
jgi:hypothetical protein